MNSSVLKAKKLTESSLAAAISAILVLLKLIAPFFVFITMLISPVPIAIICAFSGMKWGIATSVIVVLLVNLIGGPEIGLTTAFYAAALGLAMGYAFHKKWSYVKTLHITALAYIIEMSYKIIFSIYILGIKDILTTSIERLVKIIKFIWIPLAQMTGFNPDPAKSVNTTSGIIAVTVIFIINAYCYAYFNQEIGREIYKKLKEALRR